MSGGRSRYPLWVLGSLRRVRGFSVFYAILTTVFLAAFTQSYVRHAQSAELVKMWLAAPLFYGVAILFFVVATFAIRHVKASQNSN